MPTRDPEKNRQYVAKHRAMMKANEETKKEYNKLNASYFAKHATQKKEKLGTEEYNKEKAEYMRQYRAKQKQTQQQINNTKATILQSAIRNKLARNALLQQKQNKANEVVSKINQENKQSLINKLNAVVMTNDILNNLFEKPYPVVNRGPGRPKNHETQLDALQKNRFKLFFYIVLIHSCCVTSYTLNFPVVWQLD